LTYERGEVFLAELPRIGHKPVVIVSARAVNLALADVIAARVTSVERERSLPTYAALDPGDVEGLPLPSYVVCHDLWTLPKGRLVKSLGILPPNRLVDVERGLKAALDLT